MSEAPPSGFELRLLRAGEREAYLDLLEAAFAERAQFERYLDAGSLVGDDDTWLLFEGPRPVAGVQIFEKRIRLRDEVVSLGGIGSVATHPEFERRGLATIALRRAIDDMRARGCALSLLFTGRIAFYERLDWVQLRRPMWSIHGTSRAAEGSRAFRLDDLARIERIYDYYNLRGETAAVRDRAYWLEQLRYAGTPGEAFRVLERDGKVVAYARRIDFYGLPLVMEHGRAPSGAEGLADLLCELLPSTGAVVAHRTPDAELATALRARVDTLDPTEWGDTMWKVLDRPRLEGLAELPGAPSDGDLLRALVSPERAVYWSSDRF